MPKFILALILLTVLTKAFGQTVETDNNWAEEIARVNQITGASKSLSSFAIRPISAGSDSLLQSLVYGKQLLPKPENFSIQSEIGLLPVTLLTEYNLNRPYGYNNGSLYPNRGLQTRVSSGFYFRFAVLNVQIKPELVYAQNRPFNTFAGVQGENNQPQLLAAYFNIINGIDAPERFGYGPLTKIYPGQSKVTLKFGRLEAGVSTENLWWGPGVQNAIMMSNSAPGFLHWTINSTAPVKTGIGSFEWQLIGGYLKQSGYMPADTAALIYSHGLFIPKPKVTRYLSAFTINWHPKWMEGFFVGVSEYSYMNIDSTYNRNGLIKKIFPVIVGSSTRANTITATSSGDQEDFALSINLRQVFAKEKAEIYFEWARNDHWANLNDLLQEPEHSSAYTLGGRKLYDLAGGRFIQFKFELTHLQNPPTFLLRDEPIWYVHSTPPQDGYTNDGRYLGAGIGPGSNSLMIDLSYLSGQDSFGIQTERLVHDNDLYYAAFSGTNIFYQHWVDLANTFYWNVKRGHFLISSELTPVYTLNYEYKQGTSFNLHARISLSYYFN